MKVIVKSVIKSVQNYESGINGEAHHNILDVRHSTRVFLIWRVWVRASAIASKPIRHCFC